MQADKQAGPGPSIVATFEIIGLFASSADRRTSLFVQRSFGTSRNIRMSFLFLSFLFATRVVAPRIV